ncbi:formylmethanofuran dehydrogenase subunit C [Roseimaritima ulvae]|uniref:Formyltransferase/hydrolase complex Fhc subunit C n=1 Tax=Roseimaritima ulvae TaxID=980254 RepID=A0A5B9QPL1_9BACT|nr:formylmethanofuran dehydrogenase subunit C [Roseimaritima ulvae]QEG38956.1 Formyltransferase/hydrolase complex Fhc subunit C [Roseimaritima ulvae]
MNAVTLTLRDVPPQGLDMRELLPETLAGQTETQIAARPLAMGRQPTQLGDWFDVQVQSSNADQPSLRLVGDCRRLDYIGHGLSGGRLVVDGDAGHAVGHRMRGGRLQIHGAVGDHAGMSMRGGTLVIDGDAGDFVGGPAAGERSGMLNGEIVIAGNAGSHLGFRLRRGTIVVAGRAKRWVAEEMVAGTIAIGGAAGSQLAVGMRRGTVLLSQPAELPAVGFTEPRRETPSMQPLLVRRLCQLAGSDSPFAGLSIAPPGSILRSIGDRAVGGLGEVLWYARP